MKTQQVVIANQDATVIEAAPYPDCILCGSPGQRLYEQLTDRLFGAPGQWHLKKCPDKTCGVIWLDPMPLEEEIGKAYANYYTHEKNHASTTKVHKLYNAIKEGYYGSRYGYGNGSVQMWKRLLGSVLYCHPLQKSAVDLSIMFLYSQPGGSLLDVGCGSGHRLSLLRDLGWQVEGTEVDPVAVEAARKKSLKVRLGKLEEQKYADACFDVITMSHIIEHVPDPAGLLSECCRVLKPGGRVVIVTPNGKSLGHCLFKGSWIHLDPPRHLHIFCSQALRALTKKAGLQVSRCFTTLHWNDVTFYGSKSIQEAGHFSLDRAETWSRRMWAHSLEFLEFAAVGMGLGMGEELVLVATKS